VGIGTVFVAFLGKNSFEHIITERIKVKASLLHNSLDKELSSRDQNFKEKIDTQLEYLKGISSNMERSFALSIKESVELIRNERKEEFRRFKQEIHQDFAALQASIEQNRKEDFDTFQASIQKSFEEKFANVLDILEQKK
jgi:Fe2+ transport system protein B